ncbi:MAG: hypothetical protein AAGG08_03165, partial [Actinomycetota bacterium]
MANGELRWRHGRAGDHRLRAAPVASRVATRSGVHRWFPRLSGWIRLGAPISLLDSVSIARLLTLSVAVTMPILASAGGLAWQPAALGVALSLGLLLATFRDHDGTNELLVLVGSVAAVVAAVGLADDARRTGLVLLPLTVAAFYVGLFLRLRPAMFALASTAIALVATAHLTSDRQGFTGAVNVVAAALVVGAMSAAMSHGARQAGALDADTAIPNLRGIQRQLERSTEPMLVATIRLVGVAGARDALGHETGNELVRCVVEQLSESCPPPMR